MKGAVIYCDRWGPCKWVAEEIVGGLREEGHDVALLDIRSIDRVEEDFGFLAVGCPTRGPGLPLPVRRFTKRLSMAKWRGTPFAAFSTGLAIGDWSSGLQSADVIMEALTSRSLRPVAPPFKALASHMKGPLVKGELLRALRFGRQYGKILNAFKDRGPGKVSFLENSLSSRYTLSSHEDRRRVS